jgi:GNAT superfamily N-acetyltransferase
MPPVTIRHDDLAGAAGQALIGALDRELLRRHPDRAAVPPRAQEAFTNLAVGEVAPGRGAFLIASVDGADVGCGAVRDIGDRTGELKRMFVLPDHRGLGVASALVASLEDEASALGLVRIVLEVATFSDDAIAMYAKNGYREIPLFGPYVGSPISTAMGKTLAGTC